MYNNYGPYPTAPVPTSGTGAVPNNQVSMPPPPPPPSSAAAQQQPRFEGVALPPRGNSKTYPYNGQFIRKSIYYQRTRNKWVVQWGYPDGQRRTQTFNCNVLGREEALRMAEAVTPDKIPEPSPANQPWAVSRRRARESQNPANSYMNGMDPTMNMMNMFGSFYDPNNYAYLWQLQNLMNTTADSNAAGASADQMNALSQVSNLLPFMQMGIQLPNMGAVGGAGGAADTSAMAAALAGICMDPNMTSLMNPSFMMDPQAYNPMAAQLPPVQQQPPLALPAATPPPPAALPINATEGEVMEHQKTENNVS